MNRKNVLSVVVLGFLVAVTAAELVMPNILSDFGNAFDAQADHRPALMPLSVSLLALFTLILVRSRLKVIHLPGKTKMILLSIVWINFFSSCIFAFWQTTWKSMYNLTPIIIVYFQMGLSLSMGLISLLIVLIRAKPSSNNESSTGRRDI